MYYTSVAAFHKFFFFSTINAVVGAAATAAVSHNPFVCSLSEKYFEKKGNFIALQYFFMMNFTLPWVYGGYCMWMWWFFVIDFLTFEESKYMNLGNFFLMCKWFTGQ